jgi:SAM-dependent methyltransferase
MLESCHSAALGGPAFLERGSSTAYEQTVPYRLGKLAEHGVLRGDWLDCGCAEGGYTRALVAGGARSAIGVDVEEDRVREAEDAPHPPEVGFQVAPAERLPFAAERFDGVLLNEVLEHVGDEGAALREIRRVLRPGGHLALFSPNRWFPFEGHGARSPRGWTLDVPVPLLPWLPARLTRRVMRARNYWPRELRDLVRANDFEIVAMRSAFPQFEVFPWMPPSAIARYRRLIPTLERVPGARRLGVSTFVLARKPEAAR